MGKLQRELFKENGSMKGYYILLLNGKVVDVKDLGHKKLKEGDSLHIFPPIAGGG